VLCKTFGSFRRSPAAYLLVFLQVHLLGVAMLHWHGESPAFGHGARVDRGAAQTSTGECSIPCPACQIVQNGAARPATVAQPIPSSNAVPLDRVNAPSAYYTEFSAMSYGRAPPIA
jgi:hypothetical protein